MKIHPDGTLEGTAEELAAYQDAKKCGSVGVEVDQDQKTLLDQLGHPITGISNMPSSSLGLSSAIERLRSFTGVEIVEVEPGSSFNLTKANEHFGIDVVKGKGRTTVIIVKR